jgi:hypothetical protein
MKMSELERLINRIKQATHLKPHQLVGIPGLTVHDAERASEVINSLKDAAIDAEAAAHGATVENPLANKPQ